MRQQTLDTPFGYCLLGPEDKRVLDGYPGEGGFSPRRRLAILVGVAVGTWAALLAPVVPLIA